MLKGIILKYSYSNEWLYIYSILCVYDISIRCYAALGDVAKARYLRETNKIASENGKLGDGRDFYMVRARIAELEKNFKLAESIFLESQAVNEAIEMYQSIYKFEEAIEIAEAKVI